MTIGSINNASGVQAAAPSQGGKTENRFDRQIKMIKERIEEVRNNEDMDAEMKERLIEMYKEQIQELEMQKGKEAAKERQKEIQKSVEKAQENTTDVIQEQQKIAADASVEEPKTGIIFESSTQRALMQFDASKANVHTINGVIAAARQELWHTQQRLEAHGFDSDFKKAAELEARIDILTGQAVAQMSQGDGKDKILGINASTNRQGGDEETGAEEEAPISSGTGRFEPGQFMSQEA